MVKKVYERDRYILAIENGKFIDVGRLLPNIINPCPEDFLDDESSFFNTVNGITGAEDCSYYWGNHQVLICASSEEGLLSSLIEVRECCCQRIEEKWELLNDDELVRKNIFHYKFSIEIVD